tara:strand:- start:78723 stop:79049 length:327 start_codon:yes stop_codon:yes gene_type:complete
MKNIKFNNMLLVLTPILLVIGSLILAYNNIDSWFYFLVGAILISPLGMKNTKCGGYCECGCGNNNCKCKSTSKSCGGDCTCGDTDSDKSDKGFVLPKVDPDRVERYSK